MESTTRFRLAVAGAALTGCAVGAVALGPSFAGAQEDGNGDSTTTTVPADGEATPEEGRGDGDGDGERCGPGGRPGFVRPGFEAAAEAIGIEPEALREALRDGQTIAEVAESNGVEVADVVAAIVAEAQEHLAEAVADERLTQERADELAADLEQRITDLVNGELEHPFPHRPGR